MQADMSNYRLRTCAKKVGHDVDRSHNKIQAAYKLLVTRSAVIKDDFNLGFFSCLMSRAGVLALQLIEDVTASDREKEST